MIYDPSQLFGSFVKQGKQTEYDKDVELYVYQLDENKAEWSDFSHLEKALLEINTSSKLKHKDGKLELEFVAGSEHWQPQFKNYLFKDIETFTRGCAKRRSLPSKFCILDKELTEADLESPSLLKILHMTKWIKLLADMADHVQDNNVFVFFVQHKEGKAKTYQISPFLNRQNVEDLTLDGDPRHFEHLSDSWHLKDAHEKERQSVMLVSFAEIMSSVNNTHNLFEIFLNNTKKFYDRYCENYEIYVNRFTVDAQLREIDEQHLSFVGKLQDLVTSSQTKAFALPGVMVAIGALARSNNLLGALAIAVGVIMTKILISKSNEILKENLDHFKETIDRALGHYVKSRTEAEKVKSHAVAAQDILENQITKAKSRVDFIDKMSNWMLSIGLLFALIMLVSVLKSAHTEEVTATIDWFVHYQEAIWLYVKESFAT